MTSKGSSPNLREPLLSQEQENDESDYEEHRRQAGDVEESAGNNTNDNDDDRDWDGDDDNGTDNSDGYYDVGVLYPSWYLEAAEKNVGLCLVIRRVSFATRSLWHPSILSVFVLLAWRDRPEYVGYAAATAGFFQTVSSVVAVRSTHQEWFFNLALVRAAALAGAVATAVSLPAVGFGWTAGGHEEEEEDRTSADFSRFLVANGLWGVAWGLLDVGLPKILVESAASASEIDPRPSSLENLGDRFQRMLRTGCLAGTLSAGLIFLRTRNTWTVSVCAGVLALGAVTNLGVVAVLCRLRSMAMDWDDDEEEEWDEPPIGPRDGSAADAAGEPHDDESPSAPLLLPNNEEPLDDQNPDVTAGSVHDGTDGEDGLSFSSSTSSPEPIGSSSPWVLGLLCLNDSLSSLAGGLSAWYLPVFLVVRTGLSPVALLCLCCLVVPLGQWASPSLAKSLEGSIGACPTCLVLQGSYVALFASMMVAQQRAGQGRDARWLVWLLYALQGSLTNSTAGPSREVARRHDPDGTREWESSATLQKVLWSSGCLAGALVVRDRGLLTGLRSTAILQFLACLPLAAAWFLDKEEPKPRRAHQGDGGGEDTAESPTRNDDDDDDDTTGGGPVTSVKTPPGYPRRTSSTSETEASSTPATEAEPDDEAMATMYGTEPSMVFV